MRNVNRERWLTFEEEELLLSHSPKWLQEILILGKETGLCQSELLNLQWQQVVLFKKTLTILEQKNKGKDTLPSSEKAMEILKARAKVRHINSDLVFYTATGNKIDARDLLRAFTLRSRRPTYPIFDGTMRHATPSPLALFKVEQTFMLSRSSGSGETFRW